MRRNWHLIGVLLKEIEKDNLWDYLDGLRKKQIEEAQERQDKIEAGLTVSKDEPVPFYEHAIRHLELLDDAGYIKNFVLQRTMDGRQTVVRSDIRIAMSGYDLMEVLNDQKLWNRIANKARDVGVAVTCEFVKAMIPTAIRMMIDE